LPGNFHENNKIQVRMADFTTALSRGAGYLGLPQIFEFVNADGRLTKWNCGQAAAATLLTHCGISPCERAVAFMNQIERRFPPNIAGGWFGSSRRRVVSICKGHGLPLTCVRGELDLRAKLSGGDPVIVMLGVCGGRFWKWDLPGGHWMVAYGFDANAIHLTNWHEPMPWSEFRQRWRSWVSRLVQMDERGLARKSP
jgi:hypothetical protein